MTSDYGPNGTAVAAHVERCRSLTADDLRRLESTDTARQIHEMSERLFRRTPGSPLPPQPPVLIALTAAQGTAYRDSTRRSACQIASRAANDACRDAMQRARSAGWDAIGSPWEFAGHAAVAIAASDLLSHEEYSTLTQAWREAGLPLPTAVR